MLPKFNARLDGFADPAGQIHRNIMARATAHFDHADKLRDALATPTDVANWVKRTRQAFLDGIGGLPAANPPANLNARTTATLDQPDYTIENVIFESLPGWHVTTNFYLPKNRPANTRIPGVVVFCGHAGTAKAYYQGVAGILAQNGFAALMVDPTGQGERLQMIDRATGAQIVPWCTLEHTHIGLASSLIGENINRYFIWDNLRAVDYLLSRPEIDPARIAATGNSGGGTQTTYQCLFDDRLAAAAPSCYVNARREFLACRNPHDAEQNVYGTFPNMIDFPDMLMGIAPKPLLILSAASDFFPNEGTEWTFNQLKRIYGLHDKPDNIQWFVDNVPHGFSHGLRCAMVKFFNKHLLHKPEAELKLTPAPELPAEKLNCTKSGQVLMDFPDPSLMESIVSRIPKPPALSKETLQAKVRALVHKDRQPNRLHPRHLEAKAVQGIYGEKVIFYSEKSIVVSGMVAKPEKSQGKLQATLLVLPEGTDHAYEWDFLTRWSKLWTGNRLLMILDVRAHGAVKSDLTIPGDETRHYGTNFMAAYNAWMLGDNFVCAQAYDIIRAIEYLRARPDVDPADIGIVAQDSLAFAGLLAAVADTRLTRTSFPGLPQSIASQLAQLAYDRQKISETNTIHGMLKEFDIPHLLSAL
jgi:cephalosporin-C deacetylase-like acetyl esterase